MGSILDWGADVAEEHQAAVEYTILDNYSMQKR